MSKGKFTPERRREIVKMIAQRLPHKFAAHSNGIHWTTLYSWLRKGQEDLKSEIDSDFSQFFQDIERAESEIISGHLYNISLRLKNWQADAWILERRWWKYFHANAPIVELNKQLEEMEKGMKENEAGSEEVREERNQEV